jgi:hypothetical protein
MHPNNNHTTRRPILIRLSIVGKRNKSKDLFCGSDNHVGPEYQINQLNMYAQE